MGWLALPLRRLSPSPLCRRVLDVFPEFLLVVFNVLSVVGVSPSGKLGLAVLGSVVLPVVGLPVIHISACQNVASETVWMGILICASALCIKFCRCLAAPRFASCFARHTRIYALTVRPTRIVPQVLATRWIHEIRPMVLPLYFQRIGEMRFTFVSKVAISGATCPTTAL